MAVQLQLRSGTATEHNTFTGANGEVTVDTTNKTLRVHDGSTVGGTILAALTGGLVPASQLPDATTSVKGIVILNNTLASTSTNQALTAAQGKALSDTMFGVGQMTVDKTTARNVNITYTNTTGRPIFVFINTFDLLSVSEILLDGVSTDELDSGLAMNQQFSFTVRVGGTYRFNTTATIRKWLEVV